MTAESEIFAEKRARKYAPAVAALHRGESWFMAACLIGVAEESLKQVMGNVHPNPPPKKCKPRRPV